MTNPVIHDELVGIHDKNENTPTIKLEQNMDFGQALQALRLASGTDMLATDWETL